MPAISVITIVKNNEALLPRAMQSVLEQTMPDIEYVIVNDGSTDATKSVIDSYANKDNRIRPLHLEENVGRAQARNMGMDHCSGEYLFFLDSDDYLPSNALEEILNVAKKDDVDIVYGGIRAFDMLTGEWLPDHYRNRILGREQHRITLAEYPYLVNNNLVIGCLYRKKFLDDKNIRFSRVRRNGEDVTFAFYSAFSSAAISLIPGTIIYHYGRGNFIRTATDSKLNDARDNLIETLNHAVAHGSESLKKEMYRKVIKSGSNLTRAEKVHGSGPELHRYIGTLKPLYSGCPEDIIAGMPKYQQAFASAIKSGDTHQAYRLWINERILKSKENTPAIDAHTFANTKAGPRKGEQACAGKTAQVEANLINSETKGD